MKITPKIIEHIYSMLYCCEPASRWDTSTQAWTKHDKTFRNRAKAVATELGFDPLEL